MVKHLYEYPRKPWTKRIFHQLDVADKTTSALASALTFLRAPADKVQREVHVRVSVVLNQQRFWIVEAGFTAITTAYLPTHLDFIATAYGRVASVSPLRCLQNVCPKPLAPACLRCAKTSVSQKGSAFQWLWDVCGGIFKQQFE